MNLTRLRSRVLTLWSLFHFLIFETKSSYLGFNTETIDNGQLMHRLKKVYTETISLLCEIKLKTLVYSRHYRMHTGICRKSSDRTKNVGIYIFTQIFKRNRSVIVFKRIGAITFAISSKSGYIGYNFACFLFTNIFQ